MGLRNLRRILEEDLDTLVGEWMFEELFQDLERHGAAVGAFQRGLHDGERAAYAGDEDLGAEAVVRVDLLDAANHLEAVFANSVHPVDERTDEVGTDLSGQQGLEWLEGHSDVRADTLVREVLHRLDTLFHD